MNELNQKQSSNKRIFGLNRNIFFLGIISFFNDFSNEMILSAFPAFFTSVLKSGAASLGLVEGLADGAANLIKIYSGNLSDKIHKRRIFIFIGYGLSVAVRPFYMFMGSVAGVLGLRVVDRIGKGVREAPRDVIISVSSNKWETGRSFGYHRAMDTAGGILGPLAAFLILKYWPGQWGLFFMVTFMIGLISFATIFFVKEVITSVNSEGRKVFSWKTFTSFPKSFRYYLLAIFILSMGSLPTAILLLKTISVGLLIASIPLFYMVYSIFYTSFSYTLGKLSDRIGTSNVLIFGYLVLIISYLGMIFANSPILLGIFFATLGLFSACTDATQRSHVAHSVPEYERGTAFGLLNGAIGFGTMISGIVGGLIWQDIGANYALLLSASIVIIGLIMFGISKRV